jgi:small subunit ribosomal protein S6
MRAYEVLFILRPDLESEAAESVISKVKEMIGAQGELGEVDDWGNKKLAYKINNKYTEGHYVIMTFKGTNELLDALQHYFHITEPVIREMITINE